MKKKIIIILLTIFLVISLIVTSIHVVYNKVYLKNITKSANSYYEEYGDLSSKTSINVLYDLGYIENNFINKLFKGNGCKIITFKDSTAKLNKKSDCNLSKELEDIPYFTLMVSDNAGKKVNIEKNINFDININVKLKNNKDDISYEWYKDNGDKIISDKDMISVTTNETGNYTYTLYLKYNDKVYSKSVVINFDNDKPVLKEKDCNENGFYAIYEDNSKIVETMYYISEENNMPNDMTMFNYLQSYNLESDKLYYVYAVGYDEAGNYSDIEYLGEYELETNTISN